MSDIQTAAETYVRFFEELSPATVDRLDEIAVPTVRFRDPFNDFEGRDRLKALFRGMFDELDRPRFEVTDGALGRQVAYIRWTFRFNFKNKKAPVAIDGVSEVRFDDSGRVIAHIDHWDAASQFYERLPLLGWLIRRVKRRLAA